MISRQRGQFGGRPRATFSGPLNFKVGTGYWGELPIFGWYTSRGESLDGKGVTPHIGVDVDPCQLSAGVDQQMEKAVAVITTM